MTGKTHQILGLTAGLGYYLISTNPVYSPATLGAVIVGSHLAALVPDIDQPFSKIWDLIPFAGHTAGKIANTFLEHRNLTHSIIGFVAVGYLIHLLIFSFPNYWGINHTTLFFACLIAYLSHLLADMFTVEGIPLLFPYQAMMGIPPKPFEGIRIQTGKWFENLVIFPAINLILIVLLISDWSKIKLILFH